MKTNEKDLIPVAQGSAQYEGRLEHRAPPSFRDSGYRERFFKLIGNLLFYFRFTEYGTVDTKEPAGVIVLENYSVQPEYEETKVSFSFSILFLDEPDKKHIFCARTDEDVQRWVNALQKSSYQHWREKLASMQSHLDALREARKSPFLYHSERWRSPRPNPFSTPPTEHRRIQQTESLKNSPVEHRRLRQLEAPHPPVELRRAQSQQLKTPTPPPPLLPAPPLPPRRKNQTPTPSPTPDSTKNNECEDLIQF